MLLRRTARRLPSTPTRVDSGALRVLKCHEHEDLPDCRYSEEQQPVRVSRESGSYCGPIHLTRERRQPVVDPSQRCRNLACGEREDSPDAQTGEGKAEIDSHVLPRQDARLRVRAAHRRDGDPLRDGCHHSEEVGPIFGRSRRHVAQHPSRWAPPQQLPGRRSVAPPEGFAFPICGA